MWQAGPSQYPRAPLELEFEAEALWQVLDSAVNTCTMSLGWHCRRLALVVTLMKHCRAKIG